MKICVISLIMQLILIFINLVIIYPNIIKGDKKIYTVEFLDLIEYLNNKYVVLLPVYDDANQVVILQLEESYISVENENIVNTVFDIFKEKHKDIFNFKD